MTTNNGWITWYTLWMMRQAQARQEEERKKAEEKEKAEAEAQARLQAEREAKEQAEKEAKEQPEQSSTEEQAKEEPKVENTTETETQKEKTVTPIEKVESKPQTPIANTYTPKSTDCELLYEIGTSDYATCDYARAQNKQANSNIAMMLMFCIMAGIGIAIIIIHCIDRKVDEEHRNGGSGITWA